MPLYKKKPFFIYPPIPTILAFDEDKIDKVVSEEDQKRVINFALPYCDGILIGGTTGHGPALTYNQFERLLSISLQLKKSSFPNKHIFVGAIETSVGRVKEKISKSMEVEKEIDSEINGFVVAPQAFFYKKSFREIRCSMETISDYALRHGKFVYLYNIPRAGVTLKAVEVREMKNIKGIRGIKDSSGDYALYKQLLDLQDDGFSVYQGKPEYNLRVMEDGGSGIVDANANFAPGLIRQMVDCFFAGNREEASRIHLKVLDSTNYLNQIDTGLEENRLESRLAELYLLGIIETLPCLLTEAELNRIAEGITKNAIPKSITDGILARPGIAFRASDLRARINKLYESGYEKDSEGRFSHMPFKNH